MKIFYIEDDKMIADLVRGHLLEQGHMVVWESDRSRAPESFEHYDLVISDYEVPGGHFDDTKAICDREQKPLILVSGGGWKTDKVPHENFVSKPFMMTDLDKLVESFQPKPAEPKEAPSTITVRYE